jgi:nicotinate-nucleotide pyrophosphorylase (carboxylating)
MIFAHLLPSGFEQEVIQWLRDDCPSFDVGGFVVGEKVETAYLYCKQSCVLAGVPFANCILQHLNLQFNWNVEEGTEIDASKGKVVIATVTGKCRNILLAERTCLNIISRASGIATSARNAKKIKESHGWHGFVAGTRKTTPGFRTVEKYALIVGGVSTHRLDLSQMVMLKDNHIWSCGSITNAVNKARLAAGFSSKIEVNESYVFLIAL